MHFQSVQIRPHPKCQSKLALIFSAITCVLCQVINGARSQCPNQFQGFGVYLGSVYNLNAMNNDVLLEEVLDKLYFDLNVRLFRTSIEPEFSTSDHVYDISCTPSSPGAICSWIKVHSLISDKSRYPGTSFIASIWSPPSYMKDPAKPQLLQEYERAYYHFIKNATQIIHSKFGISFEQISPVNEPENIFATWNHCDMAASQLCRLISTFSDPVISLCPENSYMSISKQFMQQASDENCDCENVCKILGTHGYLLNLNLGRGRGQSHGQSVRNFGKAYYDHTVHEPVLVKDVFKPIWMTEVSSTFLDAESTQMQEALDLADHIINFVGTTCVQRYYYWFAFTNGPSGESLIWGRGHKKVPGLNATTTGLYFPKKYFVYNHFTNATKNGPTNVSIERYPIATEAESSEPDVKCIRFNVSLVCMNKARDKQLSVNANVKCASDFRFCCTTEGYDLNCDNARNALPPFSVCSCVKD